MFFFVFLTLRLLFTDDGAATTTARQRKEKQAFLLDFTIPATTTSKELFASGTTASISLPSTETASGNGKRKSSMSSNKSGGKKKSNKVEMGFMLPQDCGFGPERLLRLFLKPRTVVSFIFFFLSSSLFPFDWIDKKLTMWLV